MNTKLPNDFMECLRRLTRIRSATFKCDLGQTNPECPDFFIPRCKSCGIVMLIKKGKPVSRKAWESLGGICNYCLLEKQGGI